MNKEAVEFLQQACCKVDMWRDILDKPAEERYMAWERVLAYDLAQLAEFALKSYLHMNGIWPINGHSHGKLVKLCTDNGLNEALTIKPLASRLYDYSYNSRYSFLEPIDCNKVVQLFEKVSLFVDKLSEEYMPLVFDYCSKLPPVYANKVSDMGIPEDVVMLLPPSEGKE